MQRADLYTLSFRDRTLALGGHGRLMGIVNVTPDSFFDGGAHDDVDSAVAHGLKLFSDGAGILDIGGESTRPGFTPVSAAEEIRRVVPVIRELRRQTDAAISVDTMKGAVALAAFEAGADILNDVSGLAVDFEEKCMALRRFGGGCVVMHCERRPQEISDGVYAGWCVERTRRRMEAVMASSGLDRRHFLSDPGIGFGKTDWESWELLGHLDDFHAIGCPVLLGISRKSFIMRATGCAGPFECLPGTVAATALGAWFGADVHRVHDVKEMRDALKVMEAAGRHGR